MTTSTIETAAASPSAPHRVARYVAYPSVLVANIAFVAWACSVDVPLGVATLLGLFGTLAALFGLERALPHRRDWQPGFDEGLRDLFYFGMNGGIDAATKMGIAFGVAAVGSWDNALPFWIALPAAVLIADFAGYWLHRGGHHGWLWKVHGVHHTPDKVNTWNNNTIHVLNTLYGGLGKTLPLLLLGFSPDVIVLAAYVVTVQSFAVHANVDVELGWLERVLLTPKHHRLHHSVKLEEAGNFASVTTLWDRAFGTFVYAPDRVPAVIGVVKPETFPAPNDVLRNQLHPFVDQGRG